MIFYNIFILIGCGFDIRDWFDESSGLKQIITTDK